MNLDDMARRLPAERDLPAARKQILKEHLMTELRQADPSRARTRPSPGPGGPGARARSSSRGPSSRRRRWPSRPPPPWGRIPARPPRKRPSPQAPATAAQLLARIADRGGPPARPGRAGQRLHLHPQHGRLRGRQHQQRPRDDLHGKAPRAADLAAGGERMRHRPAHRAGRAHADLAVPGRERQGRPPPAEGHPDAELHLPERRATSATPPTGCCSPSPPSRTRCSPTSRPARSGPTTTRPPRSAT